MTDVIGTYSRNLSDKISDRDHNNNLVNNVVNTMNLKRHKRQGVARERNKHLKEAVRYRHTVDERNGREVNQVAKNEVEKIGGGLFDALPFGLHKLA